MSEDGKNIVATVRRMARLHRDIASLLRTVEEGVLGRKGWSKYNNVAIDPISSSILRPADWMPRCVFRVFVNDKMPNLLIYLSVILDAAEEGQFDEPLISAGYYLYDSPIDDRWEWRYMQVAEWLHVEQEAGKMRTIDVKSVEGASAKGIREIGLISLPLVEIKTIPDVKERLIDKLLEGIEERGLR